MFSPFSAPVTIEVYHTALISRKQSGFFCFLDTIMSLTAENRPDNSILLLTIKNLFFVGLNSDFAQNRFFLGGWGVRIASSSPQESKDKSAPLSSHVLLAKYTVCMSRP